MKKMNKFSKLLLGCLLCAAPLRGADLPVFYKASLYKGNLKKDIDNWTTTVGVRYGQGSTRSGWAGRGGKINVLGMYGQTNVTRLGLHLTDFNALESATTAAQVVTATAAIVGKPTTLAYFNPETVTALVPGKTAAGTFMRNDFTPQAGQVNFTGKLEASQFDFTLEQNLFSGFYLQAYFPLRHVNVDNIKFDVPASSALPAGAGITMANFMANDFKAILQENGLRPFDQSYKKTALSEVLLALGWQGYNDKGFGVIDSATGRIQAGIIAPVSSARDISSVFTVPLGYDGHWGVQTRFELDIGIWKYLALNANAGACIFLNRTRDMRVNTDTAKLQQGWLMLQNSKVSMDQGSVWDIAGSVRAQKFFYGLTALIGYSFNRQEDSRLSSKNNDYLAPAVATAMAAAPLGAFISPADVLSGDNRFHAWEQHTVHFLIGYDFRQHNNSPLCAPVISAEYAYVIDGRHSAATNMLAGNLALQIKMPF